MSVFFKFEITNPTRNDDKSRPQEAEIYKVTKKLLPKRPETKLLHSSCNKITTRGEYLGSRTGQTRITLKIQLRIK